MNELQSLPFKVETKGTLWEVTLEKGCYSDWGIEYLFFSANTPEEVWEYLKIYMKETRKDDYREGIIWEGRKFVFSVQDWSYKKPEDDEFWDSDYGRAYKVDINRLDVIYVNDPVLLPDYQSNN